MIRLQSRRESSEFKPIKVNREQLSKNHWFTRCFVDYQRYILFFHYINKINCTGEGAVHLVGGGQYYGRLNLSTKGTGAQCVMITGQLTKPKWFVVSLVFVVQLRLVAALHTVRGHVQSGWIMPAATEERQLYLIAEARIGESKTGIIERMLVWCVTFGWAVQTVLLDWQLQLDTGAILLVVR